MMIEPIYYSVFYDVDKPRQVDHAINKRIDEKVFNNLTDDTGPKEVILKIEGKEINYQIVSVSTFNISNTVDNHFFVVCDCKKI